MRLAHSVAQLSAVLLLACGGRDSAGTIVDDAGERVALDRPAQRIVSLSPSITEALFAIGAGPHVVGRTRWCADPPAATAVPSVGDGLDPNLELIVARTPDLVLFYESGMNAATIERLTALGIATASIRLDRFADLVRATRLLGRLTGRSARADALGGDLERQLDALIREPKVSRQRVLILAWDVPPIVIGAGSFLSELVDLAGGVNAFADLPQPSAPVSIEAIAARNPDLILVVAEDPPAFLERPEWRAVEAVRTGRVAVVSGTELSWPSVRSVGAVGRLRRILEGTE